jgi:predicted enzyme related to lactoylglutathione lyase
LHPLRPGETGFFSEQPYSSRMAIAQLPVVALACLDPEAMARFYGAPLDWKVESGDEKMWFIRAEYGDALGFQQVVGLTPPEWPGQDVPQQMHLDITVDDLDVAEAAVLALGATQHEHRPHDFPSVSRSRRSSVLSLRGLTRRSCPAVWPGCCRGEHNSGGEPSRRPGDEP